MDLSAIRRLLHVFLRSVFLNNNKLQQLPVNVGDLQALGCLGDVLCAA